MVSKGHRGLACEMLRDTTKLRHLLDHADMATHQLTKMPQNLHSSGSSAASMFNKQTVETQQQVLEAILSKLPVVVSCHIKHGMLAVATCNARSKHYYSQCD